MQDYKINSDRIQKLDQKMKKKLDAKRYQHTVSVAYTAAAMAMAHGSDVNEAYVTGLLHDNAKCFTTNKKLAICKKYQLKVSPWEKENPELLHAKVGACLAKTKYGIKDEDMIRAIANHTTGRPNMSLLEKIIYIADYIEPRRKQLKDMEEIRRLAFTDIDEALCMILKNIIEYLKTKDAQIDPLTMETYYYYKNRKENCR
ncbi:MAG: HD domain-containing protein [Lachnospiraceae bacterium]|jgi:predicted HD superfamily hydrolase involved in NAD metabolism|nr:HD domain-containing protein [Lachnospiraceae bacterium]